MDIEEYKNIACIIMDQLLEKRKINLYAVVVQGRTARIFENIPLRFVIPTAYSEQACFVGFNRFVQVNKDWLETHSDWKQRNSDLYPLFECSFDKNVNIFWGRTRQEAKEICEFYLNERLKKIEKDIVQLNADKSQYSDLLHFTQQL